MCWRMRKAAGILKGYLVRLTILLENYITSGADTFDPHLRS
jgi:hypothetical protein